MKAYSRPAIEFQAGLKVGDKFTPVDDDAPFAGQVLTVDGLIRQYKNPDDCLYWIIDEDDLPHDVRCWWLRKCCRRVK